MNPIEQYESYVLTYCDLIYSKVALKLGVYKAHVEALEREPYDMTRANPLMPLMVESIQVDCVMTVSKLIERDRGDRTFQKFLAFVESNIKSINKAYPKVNASLVTEQRLELDQVEAQVSNILTQRDKYFAHADKKYFFEQNKITEDFPDTYHELVQILRTLQGIVGKHQELMTGGFPVCMAGFAYAFSDKTINHVKVAEKEWHATYRQGEEW
ncbi:AbiU2 domain-containing protein [Salinimonas chungwhensis]|uniref:AbiU2 domain-containing protein n=1 Tax=Salinimonas chungwhensis TaxID=265425 RepID=UPI000363F33C|nr:hypothetical protein [Salinimonas chungwhensis]